MGAGDPDSQGANAGYASAFVFVQGHLCFM